MCTGRRVCPLVLHKCMRFFAVQWMLVRDANHTQRAALLAKSVGELARLVARGAF